MMSAERKLESISYDWDRAPIICELDGYRWLLGPEAEDELNFADAKVWCESVGGELPPRDILLQCCLNEDIKSGFKTSWYWSSTEFNATDAWGQYFYNGYQNGYGKYGNGFVRAVKKVKI
jgi:hypothetical protein